MAICVSQFALFALLHRTERCTVQERLTQRFPRRRLICSPYQNRRPCAVFILPRKCIDRCFCSLLLGLRCDFRAVPIRVCL